jgi:hypothetical protein
MAEIQLKRIGRSKASIRVVGTEPLIVHRFGEKARQQMLDNQQGKTSVREAKDPEAEYQASLHRMKDGRYGFPAPGFKAAIVGGARYFNNKKLSMTLLKQAIFILGEGPEQLVEIEGGLSMREDTVRLPSTTDLRYRGQFDPWAAVLEVVFMPTMLDLGSVVALVDAGGLGGIGEWRPSSKHSSTGTYGTFEVDEQFEIKEVRA